MSGFKKLPQQYDFLGSENSEPLFIREDLVGDSKRVRDFAWMDEQDWGCVVSWEEYNEVRDRIINASLKGRPWSFDYETTALDSRVAEIVGVSFTDVEGWARYIPTGHKHLSFLKKHFNFPIEEVMEWLGPLLEDESVRKVSFNLKYEYGVSLKYGVRIKGGEDCLALVYLEDTNRKKKSLTVSAYIFLKLDVYDITDLFPGMKKNSQNVVFASLDPTSEIVVNYTCSDADVNIRLYFHLQELRVRDRGIVFRIENKMATILPRMEHHGIKIDIEYLKGYSDQVEKRLPIMLDKMHEMAGEKFNPDSRQQVARVFYDKLGLPVPAKTLKGAPTTAIKQLQKIMGEHPIVQVYCDYLSERTMKSNFLDMLPKHVNPDTGRVHCDFLSLHIPTGRIQAKDPNLMNMPKVFSEDEFNLRDCFVAELGYRFLDMDFSQIELRVLASVARIPEWMRVYNRGEDIHGLTASVVFSVPLHMVTKEQRSVGKTINFGLIYGMSAGSLRNKLILEAGVEYTPSQARRYHRAFFRALPRLQQWVSEVHAFALKNGYVLTWYGRRRPIPWIDSNDRGDRGFGERSAVNTIVQGCLQYDTRILTNRGLIKIGELYDGISLADTVWDGQGWRTFVVLNRGPARLAVMICTDGSKLFCDDRHQIFHYKKYGGVDYDFVSSLKPGVRIATLKTHYVETEANYPLFSRGGLQMDVDAYETWLYFIGIFLIKGRMDSIGVAFTFPSDRLDIAEVFSTLRVDYSLTVTEMKIEVDGVEYVDVMIHDDDVYSFFKFLGLGDSLSVEDRRVPEAVFRATRIGRRRFLEGLFEFCDTKPEDSLEVKVNWELLDDIRQIAQISGRTVRVAEFTGGWRIQTSFISVSSRVFQDPRYSSAALSSFEVGEVYEDTYTLSVNHGNQRFFSSGFLSKNTAADMMKMAIIRCQQAIDERNLPAKMLLTVHDQLLFEVEEDSFDKVAPLLKEAMTVQPKRFVKIETDADHGVRWGSCKPYVIGGGVKERQRIQLKLGNLTLGELKTIRDILKNNPGPYPSSVIFQDKLIDAKTNASEQAVSLVMKSFSGRVSDVS